MKAYDFIKQAIGNKVYITGDGDLAMDRNLRGFIFDKTPLTLMRLTSGGMAIIKSDNGKEYSVRPRSLREFGT